MQESIDTPEEFSLYARARSLTHAWRGVRLFFKTTPNAWLQVVAAGGVSLAGWWFAITPIEWMVLLLTIGLVFVAECINTAIEIDINLTSPEYHPYARDTKDVAAGAVLIASTIACMVGMIIFIPPVLQLLGLL